MLRPPFEHGKQHRDAARVDAVGDSTRVRRVGFLHKRLDLDGERSPSLEGDRDARAADGFWPLAQEQAGGVWDFGHAFAGHLEAADLVGRAETVLDRADEPQRRVPVTLDVCHDVDEVLEEARACDRAVFGDVADDDDRHASCLGDADEGRRNFTDLARLAGERVDGVARDGLHRVDDDEAGVEAFDLAEHRRQIGFAREVEGVVECVGALGAHPHLVDRLLGGGVEHSGALRGDARRELEEDRRLAHARLAAQQDRGPRHKAAAEHAVELADAGGPVRDVVDWRLGDGAGGPRLADRRGLDAAGSLRLEAVDERAPGLAFWALPEPLQRRCTAFGALERWLLLGLGRHGSRLGVTTDTGGPLAPWRSDSRLTATAGVPVRVASRAEWVRASAESPVRGEPDGWAWRIRAPRETTRRGSRRRVVARPRGCLGRGRVLHRTPRQCS